MSEEKTSPDAYPQYPPPEQQRPESLAGQPPNYQQPPPGPPYQQPPPGPPYQQPPPGSPYQQPPPGSPYQQAPIIYQQPTPQTVVNVNTTAPVKETSKETPYRVGLCDCFSDFGNCLFWTCCPCCYLMQLASQLQENACYPLCYGVVPLNVRYRTLVGVKQDMCNEACTFTWCYCCAVLRLGNEMKARDYKMERD